MVKKTYLPEQIIDKLRDERLNRKIFWNSQEVQVMS